MFKSPIAYRRAFTLVEMLVAMALTLILVYAIAHFYAIIGDAVKDGRGMIEMNQQLRAVTQRLKLDLRTVDDDWNSRALEALENRRIEPVVRR